MQLSPASASALIPAPRVSATHASFDVLELKSPTGGSLRIGMVPGQRFFQHRGTAYDSAVAGAQLLAAKSGVAQVVLAAHPGMLFVVPAFVRDASTTPVTNTKLSADLAQLASLTPAGRNEVVLAIVGASSIIDMRQLPPTLGNGRGGGKH